MKNKMSILILLVAITIPQVASAAWWNPFSWKIFTRVFSPKVEMVQTQTSADNIATTTNPNAEIEKLRAEVEELKKQKTNNTDQKATNPTTKTTTETTNNTNTIPKTNVIPIVDYEAKYQKILSDYTLFRDSKLRNDIDVINESQNLIDIQKDRLSFLNGLLTTTLADIKELAKIFNTSPKLKITIDYYTTRYSKLNQDYESEKITYQEKLQQQLTNATSQSIQNAIYNIDAQNQAKQEKLNAINLEIANLNAKYAKDMKDCSSSGGTTSGVSACQNARTTTYTNDYNTLMAEFQQIKYSN